MDGKETLFGIVLAGLVGYKKYWYERTMVWEVVGEIWVYGKGKLICC